MEFLNIFGVIMQLNLFPSLLIKKDIFRGLNFFPNICQEEEIVLNGKDMIVKFVDFLD